MTTKKSAAKKASVRKAVVKKSPSKKTIAKKASAKKAVASKAVVDKAAAKKAPARGPAAEASHSPEVTPSDSWLVKGSVLLGDALGTVVRKLTHDEHPVEPSAKK